MNKLKQFITKYNKLLMEVLYVSIVILACSLISMCSLFYKTPDEIKTALSYKYNFYLLAESFIYGAVLISASSFAFYYLHPGEETTPAINPHVTAISVTAVEFVKFFKIPKLISETVEKSNNAAITPTNPNLINSQIIFLESTLSK